MITSGSGLERFMFCRASNVLHRAYDEGGTQDTSRGREGHAYLQRISEGMAPEESLGLVDERFQPAIAEIDLEDLADVIGLTAEITIAYNPETDTARVLGVALDREYEAAGLGENEFAVTMDVAGLDGAPGTATRGAVVDYKMGWGKIAPATRNWQMRGGALALARAFDLDVVDVQLIHLREDAPARRDRAVFTAADFAVFATEARVRWALARSDRHKYEQAGIVPDCTKGTWCKYCPSYHVCPAKVALIRAVVGGNELQALSPVPVPPELVAEVWKRLEEIREPIGALKRACLASARERPVPLEQLDSGDQVWLGVTESVGNEKIDANVAREVVREMLGIDSVDKVSKYTVTKELLTDECKAKAPPRKGAEKMRALMIEIRRRRGAHKPVKHDVDVYRLKAAQLPAKAG